MTQSLHDLRRDPGPRCGHCPRCDHPLPSDAPEGLCPQCLLQGVLEEEPTASEPALEPAPRGSHGRNFGDFELLEEIGRGGMGLVYRAWQVSLERTVALKLVRAGGLASEPARERFQREARALARLRHPNIVAIHEVGEHEAQPYFSMDYVEGTDLARRMRRGPMPPAEAAGLVRRVAEAVHFAHQEGTLHRDLKPSNILIDEAGQPRITDFGIAKQLKGERTLTLSGEALGTPGYMPPEQLVTSGRRPGPASDVYALGAILYELTTGRRPFDAESPVEAAMQILHKDPVSPRLHRPEIDRDFETLCLKCLERDAARRYQSARELADDLGRYLRQESLSARPISRLERAWRWCRRNPWPTLAVLALLISSLVAAFSAWTLRQRLVLSLVEQARSERLAGRREGSLRRLAEAVRLKRPLWGEESRRTLREEAVRTLITPGVEPLGEHGAEARAELPEGLPSSEGASGAWTLAPGAQRAARRRRAGGVEVWFSGTGRLETIPIRAAPVAFFNEHELLLLATEGLTLFDLRQPAESRVLTPTPLAVSPDGRVAVVEEGFGAAVLRLPEVEPRCFLPMDGAAPLRSPSLRSRHLLLSPDGALLAALDEKSWAQKVEVVSLWDVSGAAPEGAQLLSRIVVEPGSRLFLDQAAFSPDGRLLAVAGALAATGFVGIWDVETGAELAHLSGHGTPVWSADATVLLTRGAAGKAARGSGRPGISGDGAELSWRVVSSPPGYALSEEIRNLEFEAEGERLASNAMVWSVRTAAAGPRLSRSEVAPAGRSAGFGQGGRLWAMEPSPPDMNAILAWVWPDATRTRPEPIRYPRSETSVRSLFARMARGGARLAVSGLVETGRTDTSPRYFLGVWDPTTVPPSLVWLDDLAQEAGPLRFDDDGRWLAAAIWSSDHRAVGLWDVETGRQVRQWEHDGATTLSFSADGETLFTASASGEIEVTATETGRRLRGWLAHGGEILALAASPDGRFVASGGRDRQLRLWDAASGRALVHWQGHEGAVTALAFEASGEVLASGGADGRLRLWHLTWLRRGLRELGLDWRAGD